MHCKAFVSEGQATDFKAEWYGKVEKPEGLMMTCIHYPNVSFSEYDLTHFIGKTSQLVMGGFWSMALGQEQVFGLLQDS